MRYSVILLMCMSSGCASWRDQLTYFLAPPGSRPSEFSSPSPSQEPRSLMSSNPDLDGRADARPGHFGL